MAIPIIVAQVNEVLAGTYSSTTFMDTSSSICESLLQDAVAAANAVPLDNRLNVLTSSGLINLLVDLFKINLKPVNDTTVRLKCLSLGTFTQLLKEISNGENTSYVRVQTTLLKAFVALGGLTELATAMSDPRAGATQLINYAVQFLRLFVQVRFGIVCLFREQYKAVPVLTSLLHTCTATPDALNEMLSILALYTTTSFSTDEFLLFLDANVHEFLLTRVLPLMLTTLPPSEGGVSDSTRLAGLSLLGDMLERLHTFKQSVAAIIQAQDERLDKAVVSYNDLTRHQDNILSRLIADDYLLVNLLGDPVCGVQGLRVSGSVDMTKGLALSSTGRRSSADDRVAGTRPDIITIRMLCLLFLHCGERRIEAHTQIPFSLFEARGHYGCKIPPITVTEEQAVVAYISSLYSIRVFRALALFFHPHIALSNRSSLSKSVAHSLEESEIAGAYLRVMLLFLIYSPSAFKQTLIDASLLEYNALQFDTATTQNIQLSTTYTSMGSRRTLISVFFAPLVQHIIMPITQFPTIPMYAAVAFSILCIPVSSTPNYDNLRTVLHIAAEHISPEPLPIEEIVLAKMTGCFMSNTLEFLQDVFVFMDVRSVHDATGPEQVQTAPRPINHDILLLNSGINALGTALHVARCVHEDPQLAASRSSQTRSRSPPSNVVAQNQRINRMNSNMLALYSSSTSLKLFSGEKELSLISGQAYLSLLDCLIALFEVTDLNSRESQYKLLQEYEMYVVPNTIYSLYRKQDILLLLQSINSPNITLLCRNTREFLLTNVVLLLHNIHPEMETLNANTIMDAISHYILELSEALDLEMSASVSKGQTTFASVCSIDKLTFCRALLVILCDPYILLSNNDYNFTSMLAGFSSENKEFDVAIASAARQLNALLCHEILLKSVHTFCDFYIENSTHRLVDLSNNLLVNVANDIRRLREIDNLKRIHGTATQDTGLSTVPNSFECHFNNSAQSCRAGNQESPEVSFSALMTQLCDRYGDKLVSIGSKDSPLNSDASRRRGLKLLKHALIIARSLDAGLDRSGGFSANASAIGSAASDGGGDGIYTGLRADSISSRSYSILSTSTSLAQVSRLHSNKIKCQLLSYMLQMDKITGESMMAFVGRQDFLSRNGFGINTAYCRRYAHNTGEKTVMQKLEVAYTKNPTVFLVSSKFSQLQTLRTEYDVSLPNFRLQISDLLDITAWLLTVVTYDYNLRVPELFYSLDPTETGAMPFSAKFMTDMFPTYANNTLELAIQATAKAREDNDRKLHFLDSTKEDSEGILEILYRRIAIVICDAILTSLYKLRLMMFGMYGSKALFNEETITVATDFKCISEADSYIGIYTRDTDNEGTASIIPYKGKLVAYYFSETNAEVSRITSAAIVALMLTFMEPRKNMGPVLAPSRPGLDSSSMVAPSPLQADEIAINLSAISLSPLQVLAFTEMLQETLRYGFVMDSNVRYLQLNARFENCIFGNAENNVSINAHMPRVQAFLKKYGDYTFAVPTVKKAEDGVNMRASIMDDIFASGKLSDVYLTTKTKTMINIDDPNHYRHSSSILKALNRDDIYSSPMLDSSTGAGDNLFRNTDVASQSSVDTRQSVPSRLVTALLSGSGSGARKSQSPVRGTRDDNAYRMSQQIVHARERERSLDDSAIGSADVAGAGGLRTGREEDAFTVEEILRGTMDNVSNTDCSVELHVQASCGSEAGSTPGPCQSMGSVAAAETASDTATNPESADVTGHKFTTKHRASSASGPGGISKSIATMRKRRPPMPPPAAKSPRSEGGQSMDGIAGSMNAQQYTNASVTPELSYSKDYGLVQSTSEDGDTTSLMQLLKGNDTGSFAAIKIPNKDVSRTEESFRTTGEVRDEAREDRHVGSMGNADLTATADNRFLVTGVDPHKLSSLMSSLNTDIKQVITTHRSSKCVSPVCGISAQQRSADEKEATPVPRTLSDETLSGLIKSLSDLPTLPLPPTFKSSQQ